MHDVAGPAMGRRAGKDRAPSIPVGLAGRPTGGHRHVPVGRVPTHRLASWRSVLRVRVRRSGLVAAGVVVILVGTALLLVSVMSMGSVEASRAPLALALVLLASGLGLIVGGIPSRW